MYRDERTDCRVELELFPEGFNLPLGVVSVSRKINKRKMFSVGSNINLFFSLDGMLVELGIGMHGQGTIIWSPPGPQA